MINSNQNIPCPICGTQIAFDTNELLKGIKFACPNCKTEIGLADESKKIVQETMNKFDKVKANNLKK